MPWYRDANGQPVWVDDAGQQSGVVMPSDPRKTQQQNYENTLKGNADQRSGISTDISVQGEARAQRSEGFDNAKDLRNEFSKLPDVQDYRQAIKAYSTALKTAENPAGDLNLIYAFAKIMDPNSVVREGEAATVSGGDTISGQIIAKMRKELGDAGGTFRPEYRNQLRAELQNRIAEMNTAYDSQRQQYTMFAQELGVDPKLVIGEHDGTRFHADIKKYWEDQGVEVLPSATDKQGNPLPTGARLGPDDKRPGDYRGSTLGQAMSGVNEGLADTLGLPVDAMTAALNLVPRGINAAANTNIPTIENPVLGGEWLKQKMGGWGVYDQTNDPSKQFVRRVGQSVGAAAVPVAGTSRTLGQGMTGIATAAGGGFGGAAAQQAFPGNPVAEFAGETLGGGLTGRGILGASRRMRQQAIESQIPTVEQLKGSAAELYRQAESRGITATPEMTQQVADDLRQILQNDGRVSPTGRISEVYPKAKEAIQLADDYAGKTMTPTQMQTVRGVMADGMMSKDATERRTAKSLTEAFDAWANPQAPELAQARNVSSRYLNAQQLERARELADANASRYTQSGPENALRQEYRNLDRGAIQGRGRYSDDLGAAIENVSRGTPASNAARSVGKLAPTSPMSLTLGMASPAAVGTMLGGPGVGAAVGLGAGGIGLLGRAAATKMTSRAADIAELTARNGGAIPQAPLIPEETDRIIKALLASQWGQYLGGY